MNKMLRTAIIWFAAIGGGIIALMVGESFWVQPGYGAPQSGMNREFIVIFFWVPLAAITSGLVAAALTKKRE